MSSFIDVVGVEGEQESIWILEGTPEILTQFSRTDLADPPHPSERAIKTLSLPPALVNGESGRNTSNNIGQNSELARWLPGHAGSRSSVERNHDLRHVADQP